MKEREYERKVRTEERKARIHACTQSRQQQQQKQQQYQRQQYRRSWEGTEEDDNEEDMSWKGFLSFRGPRDIIQAVKSGIKSLAFGFGTGLACLLVPPYALSSKGLPGVLLGVVIGMFGAAGTVISGMVACACFLIAGLIKTPGAIWTS